MWEGSDKRAEVCWGKSNFLWMMYRSGWGTKEGQEVTLAVRLRRAAFDALLAAAVPSTFVPARYADEAEWQRAVQASAVRLQWDPDHDPAGRPLERRALQLGLRGEALRRYSREWILGVEDVSAFVREQHRHALAGDLAALVTPHERLYPVADAAVAALPRFPALRAPAAWRNPSEANPMLVLFCADPLRPRRPDDAYAAEVAAAEAAGFAHALVGFEALVHDGDAERAVRRVPERGGEALSVYRGWMLRPEHYARLYDALLARGVRLINDPAAYRHCHHLPESYAAIAGATPRSVWLPTGPDVDMERVMELLRPFGDAPVLVKDYVKSRKHEWAQACYIPSAADRAAVERVVRRFVELQGEELAGGLVFREFVELEQSGAHPRSGMPLAREYRTFYLDGAPLYTAEYWEAGDHAGEPPPPDLFAEVARGVASRCFTMDVARRKGGDWLIVELGDGQVAGLPERADPAVFYCALAGRWPSV